MIGILSHKRFLSNHLDDYYNSQYSYTYCNDGEFWNGTNWNTYGETFAENE